MKILVLTDHWEPESNVPQRRWKWLAQVLTSQGHRIFIATPESGALNRRWHVETGQTATAEVVLRTTGRKGAVSLTRRAASQAFTAFGTIGGVLGAIFRKELPKPDLIIGTVPGLPTASVTHAIATILRVPYALDVRDAWPDLLDFSTDWNHATGRRSVRERIFSMAFRGVVVPAVRVAMWAAYSGAAVIWTTSERFALELRVRFADQLNPLQVAVVRNVFPPQTILLPSDESNSQDEFRVIYAGKIGRAQQLDNAIRAAHLAQGLGVPLKLRFVGSGVAVDPLRSLAETLGVDAEFFGEVDGAELANHYRWADSALVHLAEWEPLKATVPSKTFELIYSRIHITGVVNGETAELIDQLSAGDAVEAGNPERLAELWHDLWRRPSKLRISDRGRQWVVNERDVVVPNTVSSTLERVGKGIKGA